MQMMLKGITPVPKQPSIIALVQLAQTPATPNVLGMFCTTTADAALELAPMTQPTVRQLAQMASVKTISV